MNVLVVSCNHHKAGVQLRERLAFSNSELLNNAYSQWREIHPDSELVVLSTCNRVEIYAATEHDSRETLSSLRRFLLEERGYAVTESELEPGLVAVAAAVLGPDGRAVAAISVSGPTSRLTPREVARAGALLVSECAALSSPLPHHDPARPSNRKEGAA